MDKKLDKKYDAIVVGGGHNGLVAATYLAKAGKSVVLLESASELGGATTSVRPFPGYDARLSRYSYLVSLLPDQIVIDLGINFKTLERSIASYTPYQKSGKAGGLLISQNWDARTAQSFRDLTGSDQESQNWQNFYNEIAKLAERIAPSMLQPLKSAADLKSEIGLPEVWNFMMEQPIGEVIQERFKDDLVRGVVLTDALIGTFSSAQDLQANRCFLYHLIGNGTGQWRVPQGGMGAFVTELNRVALFNGVEIKLNSQVIEIDSKSSGVAVTTSFGDKYVATDLLFAGAPQTLAKLRGTPLPESLEGSQMKINMLLNKLPRLKSGIDPKLAFAGTFHVNESYSQLETAYKVAKQGQIPNDLPLEMYCHTLTDSTILSPELIERGFHTLTLFGLHTPASLFDAEPTRAQEAAKRAAIESLNQYLEDPIESVLAVCGDGSLAIEAKSPIDLENDLGLPRGNIFHRDLDFPFLDGTQSARLKWGSETDDSHIFLAGAGARRGGGVSGIAGHNAAMAVLAKD
jgi:phytoene dehydrogenase-like protein